MAKSKAPAKAPAPKKERTKSGHRGSRSVKFTTLDLIIQGKGKFFKNFPTYTGGTYAGNYTPKFGGYNMEQAIKNRELGLIDRY
jgi:hypothetical protein